MQDDASCKLSSSNVSSFELTGPYLALP